MKKYKIGSLVYERIGEAFSQATTHPYPILSELALRHLIKDGIATEVREPIVASGVMEFNGTGFCQSGMVPACGLTYNQVSGKTFKVTMEEVME